jgi:sortase A
MEETAFRRRVSKGAEGCLWAVAITALGGCAYVEMRAWIAQAEGNRELNELKSAPPADPSHHSRPATGAIVGRLEIPRLGMSMVVFEGTDADILDVGAGHWTGSPLPGGQGNVVVAGHRDTFFRGLRNIRNHDVVAVSTVSGTERYEVESTRVVHPTDLRVLAPTSGAVLTLITCYPFVYVGHAPQRFIVRASRIQP